MSANIVVILRNHAPRLREITVFHVKTLQLKWSIRVPKMKAIVIDGYGGVDQLHLRELPDPRPQADEVLMRVRAAGVNPVDWKIRQGQLWFILRPKFPFVPGGDIAGEVVSSLFFWSGVQSIAGIFKNAKRAKGILVRPSGKDLAYLCQLADEGKLRPTLSLTLSIDRAADAHEASEAGHTRGKIVLEV